MEKIMKSLKKIDYKLFTALLIMALLPLIYSTTRIYFLGDLPADWGVNIASQLSWVGLFYEIIQEAIILPLFYFIGGVLDNPKELSNRVKTGLITTFLIYTLASITIIIFARPLVEYMAQSKELVDATVNYIRLETVAYIFITLVKFSIIVLITLKQEKSIYFVLFIQMIISILLDMLFISKLSFSLDLGVNGIAYTNIISNMVLLILMLGIFMKKRIFIKNEKLTFSWLKSFIKIGGISGLESLVRNLAFMIMIIKMINMVGEQGVFWLANSFIWGWLLLPVLQLGELIKRDCGVEEEKAVEDKTFSYGILTTIIVIIWIVTIPLWKGFIRVIYNSGDYEKIYYICLISVVFYIIFAYNNILDSIFYGLGRTDYMLYQSLIINIFYYGGLYILYKNHLFIPSLTKIALMFGIGMALDSIVTLIIFLWMVNKKRLKLHI